MTARNCTAHDGCTARDRSRPPSGGWRVRPATVTAALRACVGAAVAAALAIFPGGSGVQAGEAGGPAATRAGVPPDQSPPHRIVSLNLCADEMLLRLVPRERIASVTFLGADPVSSTVADRARGLPLNRGLAEEIIPLGPDLVVTGAYTTRAATEMLRRFGIAVLELPLPVTPEEAIAQVRMLARRVGAAERGEEMARQMEAALAPRPRPAHPRTAIVVRPNGFTTGADSLPDAMMRRAGLDNLAARLAPDRLGQLSLEEIVTSRPEVLVVEVPEEEPPSVAQSVLDHPALRRIASRAQVVAVPTRLWACPGPQLSEAMDRLTAAAQGTAPPRGSQP